MDTERIPKMIDDHLVDAYVELYFNSDFKTSFLEKIFLNIFVDAPFEIKKIPVIDDHGDDTGKFFFTDNVNRFFIREDKMGFNFVGKYRGWSSYGKYIKLVMLSLAEYVNFSNIRLKYVSKWNNVSILDRIDGQIKLNRFKSRFDNTSISFPAVANIKTTEAHVIVNLKENIHDGDSVYSLVDIDVRCEITPSNDSDKNDSAKGYEDEEITSGDLDNKTRTLACIEDVHSVQKDMFFKLLSEEFVASLNPQW